MSGESTGHEFVMTQARGEDKLKEWQANLSVQLWLAFLLLGFVQKLMEGETYI